MTSFHKDIKTGYNIKSVKHLLSGCLLSFFLSFSLSRLLRNIVGSAVSR